VPRLRGRHTALQAVLFNRASSVRADHLFSAECAQSCCRDGSLVPLRVLAACRKSPRIYGLGRPSQPSHDGEAAPARSVGFPGLDTFCERNSAVGLSIAIQPAPPTKHEIEYAILHDFPPPDLEHAWRVGLSRVDFPAHY